MLSEKNRKSLSESGKPNHITTDFYHPQMDWTLIAFREDYGSKAELAR